MVNVGDRMRTLPKVILIAYNYVCSANAQIIWNAVTSGLCVAFWPIVFVFVCVYIYTHTHTHSHTPRERRDGEGERDLTVYPCNGNALEECNEENDFTPWIVVKQLEDVHSALQTMC